MVNTLSANEIKHELVNAWQTGCFSETSDKSLIRAIQGYGEREGIFDSLAGLAYRIWNAVKSIFGSSDWQIAKRDIATDLRNDFDSIFKATITIINTSVSTSQEKKEIKDQVDRFTAETTNNMAESLLQLFINSTYEKNYETKTELHDYVYKSIEKLRQEKYLNPIEKFVVEKLESWTAIIP